MAEPVSSPVWALDQPALLKAFGSSENGLSDAEAASRLAADGPNSLEDENRHRALRLLLRQVESPMVLVLLFGAGLAMTLREWSDAIIIVTVVAASALLGFSQEYKASTALLELKKRLALSAKVRRGGAVETVPAVTIVKGDIVELAAGNLVPADGVVLKASDFLVSEATLTGESMPVEKRPGTSAPEAPLAKRLNCVFGGTSVRSGTASVLITATGRATEVGNVARMITGAEGETEFARGIKHFGYLLIRVMIVMVLFVLITSQLLHRPLIESLLFAVALAIGMTPELLPAIVTVTLSTGARAMAKEGVIVRRLEALENLGSINILCTDKTGTLTEGAVRVDAAVDCRGAADDAVLRLAVTNAALETGIDNPMDQALLEAGKARGISGEGAKKLDEIPYDFTRKRLTIVIESPATPGKALMITKGSFATILAVCGSWRDGKTVVPLDKAGRAALSAYLDQQCGQGFRLLALATKEAEIKPDYTLADENDMVLEGFLLFADPPKAEARAAIASLAALGISLKVISGDNAPVTRHVADALGIPSGQLLTGPEIAAAPPDALPVMVEKATLFAEIDPQQKERIITALQKRGHAVGYMGDGINDAPALRAADIGISVDTAVDVARQTADIILLKRDLNVLRMGVESGRRTFANTMKYISMTTSANFGNMLSMALATPLLPFLPLLAKQILLNNFLSDLPSMAIAGDNVDAERISGVQRWSIRDVQRFMLVFGPLSSVFDLITFAVLLYGFTAREAEFQTAWFTVSLLTEVVIVLVLRTRKPAWQSRPGNALLLLSAAVAGLALGLPYIPLVARLFGFVPLPLSVLGVLVLIAVAYVLTTEIAKALYYSWLSRRSTA
ncbi:magnesium-translocating P-type ATPase [Aestuariivirga sp.]|uniref:magnesium-translocating P-type ATPase n=1 Tax=Aestuariivirga sp. TaxID=2650926 RepID=UPI0039E4BC79